jgi:hypothetical protein
LIDPIIFHIFTNCWLIIYYVRILWMCKKEKGREGEVIDPIILLFWDVRAFKRWGRLARQTTGDCIGSGTCFKALELEHCFASGMRGAVISDNWTGMKRRRGTEQERNQLSIFIAAEG